MSRLSRAPFVLFVVVRLIVVTTSKSAPGYFRGARADGTIELRFAQTHVLDGNGEKTWTSRIEDGPLTMHLVANKKTLALVHLSGSASADEKPTSGIVTLEDGTVLTLQSSSTLPETFDTSGDATYAYEGGKAMWTDIPRENVQTGMSVIVKITATESDGALSTPLERTYAVTVGAPNEFKIISMPCYYFGADETIRSPDGTLTLTKEVAGKMGAAKEQLAYDRFPVSEFSNELHPAGKIEWPELVIGPSNSYKVPARRATSKADVYDGGFSVIGKSHESWCC